MQKSHIDNKTEKSSYAQIMSAFKISPLENTYHTTTLETKDEIHAISNVVLRGENTEAEIKRIEAERQEHKRQSNAAKQKALETGQNFVSKDSLTLEGETFVFKKPG